MIKNGMESLKIWVNGASRGIGSAIAGAFSESGASLFLTASSMESFDTLEPKIKSNDKVILKACDISSPDQVKAAADEIQRIWGCPDILINNAGIAVFRQLKDFSLEDFDRICSVNFRGTFLCTRSVLPEMIRKKSGMIINILSVAAIKPFTFSSVYGATKAAILAMDRSLREEVRSDGIKVVDIIPGATETGVWSAESLRKHGSRMMQPEDIADVVYDVVELSLSGRLMVEEIVVRPQNGDL